MAEDDEELFRAAVRGTRPLRKTRPEPPRPRLSPRARSRRADERAVLEESLRLDPDALEVETGEEISYARTGTPVAVQRRLRRGAYAQRAELDLHGMTRAEAREALREFLAESLAQDLSCVRVIHGKGRGSGQRGPVLKASVNGWLRRHAAVRAFCTARRADGGSGAIYVLLDS